MSATTDSYGRISYNPEKQPGVTNLLDLLALLSAQPIEEIKKKYEGQIEYGPLKVTLGDIVSKFLVDFQRASISVDTNTLLTKLEESERLMNVQANTKLHLVQQVVGLRG